MSFKTVIHLLAPHSFIGWVGRLTVMLAAVLVISLLPHFLLTGVFVYAIWSSVVASLLVGIPLSLSLLWCMSQLAHERDRRKNINTCDGLTALHNHKTFHASVDKFISQSGVLMVFDIDHLRSINENWGHQTGDLCIMVLAQRMREVTRNYDIIGRLDGPVFAIFLPGAPAERAQGIADRICTGLILRTQEGLLHLSVSAGATLVDGQTPLDKLLQEADVALEGAKLQGRGRIVLRNHMQVA